MAILTCPRCQDSHDLGTGKLLHEKDIVERDEAVVWGPIPLISPSTSPRTSPSAMKEKCLFALTDKAVAEAFAFLSLAKH